MWRLSVVMWPTPLFLYPAVEPTVPHTLVSPFQPKHPPSPSRLLSYLFLLTQEESLVPIILSFLFPVSNLPY